MLEAVTRKAESSVASCGADTREKSGWLGRIKEERTIVEELVQRDKQICTLVEERIGQLHLFEQLLCRIFIDVVLMAWQKKKKGNRARASLLSFILLPL